MCGEVRDEMHAEVDDAVREEVLVPSALEDVPGDEPIGTLRDEEARDAEIPQPLEQSVHLAPTVLELRQDLERLERVDHDQVESPLFFDRSDRSLEAREPVGLLAKEVLRGPRVKDDERTFRDLEWEAQAAHLLEQARRPFLQAQIEAVEFLLHGILNDDRESKGRFHRAGGALDDDDVAAGDPTFQDFVEPFDEGPDPREQGLRLLRRRRGVWSWRLGGGRLQRERLLHLVEGTALRCRLRRARLFWRR